MSRRYVASSNARSPLGSNPSVSIVIPTYNRVAQLRICLQALETQTFPLGFLEVIIVDDGSTDATPQLISEASSLNVRIVAQQRQGQVAALNAGARMCQGEVMVFLDDDAVVPIDFVQRIVDAHRQHEPAIVLPVVRSAYADQKNPFARISTEYQPMRFLPGEIAFIRGHFTDLVGCCFSVKRKDFFAIGQMQTLPGRLWPDWNDVDFAYRAHQEGFEFWICPSLTVLHFESALSSCSFFFQRSFNAGRSANWLFQRHPDLIQYLPMFRDKTPLSLHRDPPMLVCRKIARQIISCRPAVKLMDWSLQILEQYMQVESMLALLYRWTNSGYIYQGYRQGLGELRAQEAPKP